MNKRIVVLVGTMGFAFSSGAMAQEPRGAQFPQGECSGILCSTIGGSQAPQNQPRKSLFPEGECGGVLCNAIGGSQAPRHAEPPPACGGGLLCDMAPYAMGQPFVRPQESAQRVEAAPPAAVATPKGPSPRHHKTAAAKRTAATN